MALFDKVSDPNRDKGRDAGGGGGGGGGEGLQGMRFRVKNWEKKIKI